MRGDPGNGVDILSLVLVAFGISSTGVEFLGGLALGLAGAFAASRILAAGMVKNAKPLGILGAAMTGLFVSILAAMFAEYFVPDMAIQLPMAVGGFLSSFIAPFALKVAAGISNRGDQIAGRAVDRVLPQDKSKGPGQS